MKKFITLALILAFVIALCACDAGKVSHDSQCSTENTLDSVIDSNQDGTDVSQDTTQSWTNDSQGTEDSTHGGTANTNPYPVKWTEEDLTEENWNNVIYPVYKQYAEHFKKFDTSKYKLNLMPDFKSAEDASDLIYGSCGPEGFEIQFTSNESSEEALDKIAVGDHWVKVYNCDYNLECFEWLRFSNHLTKQVSYHFSKEWIYYFEYECYTVKKIVKITPEGMSITGEDADRYTDNLWSEEDLQEESWQKIYQTYVNVKTGDGGVS